MGTVYEARRYIWMGLIMLENVYYHEHSDRIVVVRFDAKGARVHYMGLSFPIEAVGGYVLLRKLTYLGVL